MTTEDARSEKAIPCGLLEGGTVSSPIKKGALLTYDNAAVEAGSKLAGLRARQDALVATLD